MENADDIGALLGSNRLINLLMERAFGALVFYEYHEGVIERIRISDGYYTITGETPESLAKNFSTVESIIHPEDVEIFRNAIEELVKTKQTTRCRMRMVRSNGTHLWLEGVFIIVGGNDERPVICASYLDVSGNMELDKEQETARLGNVLLSIYDEVIKLDKKENELTIMKSAQEKYTVGDAGAMRSYKGVEAEEAVIENAKKLVHPADRKRVEEFLSSVPDTKKKGGTVSTEEYRAVIDGELKWVSSMKISLEENIAFICSSDITAQREADASRLEAIELENKEKTRFLTRISHDLRIPLNSIIGTVDLAEHQFRADDKTGLQESFDNLKAVTNVMLGQMSNILDMAEIEKGIYTLKPERYAYKEFVDAVKGVFEPLCHNKNIELVIKAAEIDRIAFMDRKKFNQIFFDLLTNSLETTQPGGKIECDFSNVKIREGIAYCRFLLTDNGPGLSREIQEKLRNYYETESDKNVPGTIDKEKRFIAASGIIKEMGGSMSVKSEVNKGTEVRLYLELPIDLSVKGEQEEEAPREKTFKGKRVLVAEDNDLNAKITTFLLEEQGLAVEVARNGKEALEMVRDSEAGYYDAILMDLIMPEMDGWEASEAIRDLEREDARKIPIIAISANAFTDDVEKSKLLGINDHLPKPVIPQLLYDTLAKYMGME
ncbi:MAG: response regulator [Bacillota bacterium]|nr:response regulator [Bacillota bacterium]